MQTHENKPSADDSNMQHFPEARWNIVLHGVEYPARTLYLPDWGWNNISIESLGERIMNNEGDDYSSPEACAVDEQFLFYVPDNAFHWSDARLSDFVLRRLA